MEKVSADQLPVDWDEVMLKSKNVDASLAIVKRKFTLACLVYLLQCTTSLIHF